MSTDNFAYRHIGPRDKDVEKMLEIVNASSMECLINETIPKNILLNDQMNLPDELSETRFIEHMQVIARKNKNYRSYLGMGYYNTILPGVIQRNILENPSWYTAYTPYQAEIAQGRLEALLNYQTMVCELTGMDIANASLLDEGTAAAEAMGMSHRLNKKDSKIVFLSENCHPQTIDIIKTRAEPLGLNIVTGNNENDLENIAGDIVCGVIQ